MIKIDRSQPLTPRGVASGDWHEMYNNEEAIKLTEVDLDKVKFVPIAENYTGIPLDAKVLETLRDSIQYKGQTLPANWIKAMKEDRRRIFFPGTKLIGRNNSGSPYGTYIFGLSWFAGSVRGDHQVLEKDPCCDCSESASSFIHNSTSVAAVLEP